MDGASAVERIKGLGLRFRVWGLGYSMKTFATVRRVALARKYRNAVLTQQKSYALYLIQIAVSWSLDSPSPSTRALHPPSSDGSRCGNSEPVDYSCIP